MIRKIFGVFVFIFLGILSTNAFSIEAPLIPITDVAIDPGHPELVKDICPGNCSSVYVPDPISPYWNDQRWHVDFGSFILFTANDGTNGHELWKSDGTAGGTVMVKNIGTGPLHSNPVDYIKVGNVVYFLTYTGVPYDPESTKNKNFQLWRTDGTTAGTTKIKDLGNPVITGLAPTRMGTAAGKLYFSAPYLNNGIELWVIDSIGKTPRFVKDLNTGSEGSLPMLGWNRRTVYEVDGNGKIYFPAWHATAGLELFVSDGTTQGTFLLKDIMPGTHSSSTEDLVYFNGAIYFDASHRKDTMNGWDDSELWKTDGTSNGTVQAVDIWSGQNGSTPSQLKIFKGELYFAATTGQHGRELWKTDGTTAGTKRISDINSLGGSSFPEFLAPLGNQILFNADNGWWNNGKELFGSNGTLTGTAMVKDINPQGDSVPNHLTAHNSYVYFSASEPTTGLELWRSDGTPAGTTLVTDLWSGQNNSAPISFIKSQQGLFFRAKGANSGGELYILR